jgi:Tfp pilus assembly protein PilF
MFNLGLLQKEQGDPERARHRYEQATATATATGDPEATSRAEHELRELDRREHDRREAERFGRYGYLAYADSALINWDGHPAQPPSSAVGAALPPAGDAVGQDDASP